MKRSLTKYLTVCILVLFVLSCGVSRHTPPGSYFLQGFTVEEDIATPSDERIPAYTFATYLRQLPNKRLLGANFYVWAYNLANPEKDNAWTRFLHRIGQAPIYYDETLTERGAENLKVYMNSQGYYASTSSFEVDTTRREGRAHVTYRVKQNKPYTIVSHKYRFRDTLLSDIVLRDTASSLIKVGDIFNATVLDAERTRIANDLRKSGYYDFTTNNVAYVADTLAGDNSVTLRTIIKRHLAGYDAQGTPILENNTRYRVNDVSIIPDFDPTIIMSDTAYLSRIDTTAYRDLNIVYEGREANVRSKVLRQAIPIYANTYFNSTLVDETYNNLMSIGYFKSAQVTLKQTEMGGDSIMMSKYNRADTLDTSSPVGNLSCRILCTPALTQSIKLEAEGSSTTSFYGLSLTAGYQNRNIFRGAEAFDLAFTTGYEYMKDKNASKRRATELGVAAGLSFPRFIIPVLSDKFPMVQKPRTKVEMSVNYQDRPYYKRTLASASWNYSWRNSGYSSFNVRPININLIDVDNVDPDFYNNLNNDYLELSFQTQLVAGLSFNYVYNDQMKRGASGDATLVRYNFESSGNLIDVLERTFDKPAFSTTSGDIYHIFGVPYAQYIRTDLSLSHKIVLGKGTALAGRLYGGVGVTYGNSKSSLLPFDRLFYAGGSNSMRGWSPRTLGPGGTYAGSTVVSEDFPNKVGDVKLEANLELRFPVWSIINGATFLDCGNVWYRNDKLTEDPAGVFHLNSFYKQLGLNTGIGMRIDITFAILRIDWGFQLHNPNRLPGQRWIRTFNWNDTTLNFAVGYPF